MNKHRDARAPKTEPRARAISPAAVNQSLGGKIGDHLTDKSSTGYRGEKLIRGKGYEPPGMISDPVKAVGVAGGRKVYGSGSQSQHGDVAGTPRPAGRGILTNE